MTRSQRYRAYRREVARLTDEHSPPRAGLTRQHHVPVGRGFAWGIPAELVGSPENVTYWPLQDNINQGTRIGPEGEELLRAWGLGHRITWTHTTDQS